MRNAIDFELHSELSGMEAHSNQAVDRDKARSNVIIIVNITSLLAAVPHFPSPLVHYPCQAAWVIREMPEICQVRLSHFSQVQVNDLIKMEKEQEGEEGDRDRDGDKMSH